MPVAVRVVPAGIVIIGRAGGNVVVAGAEAETVAKFRSNYPAPVSPAAWCGVTCRQSPPIAASPGNLSPEQRAIPPISLRIIVPSGAAARRLPVPPIAMTPAPPRSVPRATPRPQPWSRPDPDRHPRQDEIPERISIWIASVITVPSRHAAVPPTTPRGFLKAHSGVRDAELRRCGRRHRLGPIDRRRRGKNGCDCQTRERILRMQASRKMPSARASARIYALGVF